jgi:Ser/Thr protein kinase RdoA (MazF antagonist)
MSSFPVINSNLSPTHLAAFVQEKYDLGKCTTCSLLKAGINHTYLIKDAEKPFVFRVYSFKWRSREEILEEIRLLNVLKSHEISISYPLLDTLENYIQAINAPEGERFAVLFSFAEGEKLLSFDAENHYQIGALMAKIHQITEDFEVKRVNYTAETLLGNLFNYLPDFLSDDTEEMAFMKSTQKYLFGEFEKVDISEVRKGTVHLDIWFDNLNITKDGKITIFDFDFCGNGWLCMDIAYYILQLHSTEREETICQPKIQSFLAGYESVMPISEQEKQILPMLGVSLYFFYIGIQCQRFDNWSNTFLNEMYLKRFINLLIKRYFDLNKLG